MAEWKGKSRGNKAGHQFFVVLLKNLGLYPAYGFLLFIAAYFYFFATADVKKWMRYYFSERIGFSKWKTEWKIYQNYFLLGQVLIDKVAILSGMASKYSKYSTGAENLHAAIAENKGTILLGAHLGNWEISGHFLSTYMGKVNILMYDGENEKIKDYLENETNEKRFNVINIKNDLSHVYAISEALERNELVCIHGDRFMEGNRTISVPFLGKEAQFPFGVFQLIKSVRANYTFVYGIKTGLTHYDFYARPHRSATAESKVEDMIQDYVADLEDMVKKNPEQWFNYYDFWKAKTT